MALAFPAGTVTVAGTAAAEGLLLESVTVVPPLGAGPFKVAVPCDGFPPTTEVGFRAREITTGGGGLTPRRAVFVVPPAAAEMVTDTPAITGWVVTAKVPLVLPGFTMMLAGTVAAEVLSLERVTTVPPVGAGPVNVTVP